VWSGPGHPASCCPTMGQPAASCLQESFDAAVKENQEEFGMEVLTFQSAGKVHCVHRVKSSEHMILQQNKAQLKMLRHTSLADHLTGICSLCRLKKPCRVPWRSSGFRCVSDRQKLLLTVIASFKNIMQVSTNLCCSSCHWACWE
jgi:hypothetical protein